MHEVLDEMGVRATAVTTLKDVPPENGSWLIETAGGERAVLRRYHDGATPEDLAYEYAVLRHLDELGWAVPVPLGELLRHGGSWYCLTRYVPGEAVRGESVAQRRRRGCHLARLDFALRDLGDRFGQRPGWRAQHDDRSVHTGIAWDAGLAALGGHDKALADRVAKIAEEVWAELRSVGASELPVTVVHGDFAEWNVHYFEGGELAGVVDFGLTHLDSRPYELAIARTWRAPEAIEAYAEELERLGWPLSELERACVPAIHRAFRVDMVAWELHQGLRTGTFDVAMIERQLKRAQPD